MARAIWTDEYRRDLMQLIQRKAKAGQLNSIPEATKRKPKAAAPQNVVDLAELLAKSVASTKKVGHRRSA